MVHTTSVFSPIRCSLGEGPLWHPARQELFWFDILTSRLHARSGTGGVRRWDFSEMVSCAGWVDADHLLIAGKNRLFLLNLENGRTETVVPLEAERDGTRSNDGRADPAGGFWVSTIGLGCEEGAGAIYRWYRGELRLLHAGLSIPNSICFSPNGQIAYFADGARRQIYRQPISEDGWPIGAPQVFLDFSRESFFPDGSVTDTSGTIWNAQWGAGRVRGFSPSGRLLGSFDVPAIHCSCPAFGGEDLDRMFVTSAGEGLSCQSDGMTFELRGTCLQGKAEPAVLIG